MLYGNFVRGFVFGPCLGVTVTAFYNEIDPFAARWLRNLIDAGHIAPGIVDERNIRDITPQELSEYTQCHFFAGIGVWSYALRQAGWEDDRPVWTGSCPCQPFSAAGKGAGFDDERHLWPDWHHLIAECGPATIFGEQVASKDGLRWYDLIQSDLEGAGYACGATDLCAAGIGAPHIRQRLWFVADTDSNGCEQGREAAQTTRQGDTIDPARGADRDRSTNPLNGFWADADWIGCRDNKWRAVEPSTSPLADGVAARVGRLRGYGNAITAPLATVFIKAYVDTRKAYL